MTTFSEVRRFLPFCSHAVGDDGDSVLRHFRTGVPIAALPQRTDWDHRAQLPERLRARRRAAPSPQVARPEASRPGASSACHSVRRGLLFTGVRGREILGTSPNRIPQEFTSSTMYSPGPTPLSVPGRTRRSSSFKHLRTPLIHPLLSHINTRRYVHPVCLLCRLWAGAMAELRHGGSRKSGCAVMRSLGPTCATTLLRLTSFGPARYHCSLVLGRTCRQGERTRPFPRRTRSYRLGVQAREASSEVLPVERQ
jgi:hypothetical protein